MTRITSSFLKNHPDLLIACADKGNTTVALDKSEYIHKMEDSVKRIINDLRILIIRWRKHDYISASKLRALCIILSDGMLPRAYGLPKIHNCPLRIIISSINSPLHSFAAFLHNIIFKRVPKSNSYDHQLVSLDVISLFTNVPNDLAIRGIGKRWHFIEKNTSIPYKEFSAGVRLVLNSTFFKFNGRIYRQTFGSPMGFPCLYISNMWMISLLPLLSPFFLPSSFNSLHKRLQFTLEASNNNNINYLDLSINLIKGKIICDWYRKPIFSGRLVNRVFRLSHPIYYEKNLNLIISILLNNDYPLRFIFDTIHNRIKFLISKNTPLNNIPSFSSPGSPPSSLPYFTIPFIRIVTEKLSPLIRGINKSMPYVYPNKLNRYIKT
ncbi:hypothetical protein ACFW04_014050 [Cataglyphis niger]